MPNVVPWSSFSPYISNTSGRPSITSWSRREKRKSIHHGKPTEVTKMSDVKPLYWEPIKQKIGWKGAKERKQSDIAHVIERLEQKQGKSLAVAHKKENNQLIKTKQSLENLKHLQEYRMTQEEKKLRKLLLKPTRDYQLYNLPHVPLFLRKSLKQMKISSEESSLIQEPSYLPSLKEANKKLMGDLDGPEVVMSATPRLSMPRRSSMDPNTNQFIQDTFSSSRKGMTTKVIDPSASLQGYDRKIKNLIEKTPNVKSEITSTLLKPQEVLSCRYLRLSKNNIQTLIRLCREAGMDIDIHPHMNESEMNANRIFNRKPSIAL
ncbi:uncharacterized protein C16orf78 homolog isoform X2 [Trichosurus vulpecula]|uniref:uncharacterized protein C16orf78 homolog isoform X2 n=1 Tax=Trichosurus vulpecula TaxID=9337 RepID=UPI00186AFDC4|nr:uncharacterized protein C16orf78 homolog isoform X2 [Trichosurus vulpecula]